MPIGCMRRERKKRLSVFHTMSPYFKRISPVSLSVFCLAPDLLFDCSCVFEYTKIWTVLRSNRLELIKIYCLLLFSRICGYH